MEGYAIGVTQELDAEDSVWRVHRFASRSFDDEFGSTISSDLQLLQVLSSTPGVMWRCVAYRS